MRFLTTMAGEPTVAALEHGVGLGRTAARNVLSRLDYAARRQPLGARLPRAADGRRPRLVFSHLDPHTLLAALLATPAPTDCPHQTAAGPG